jgi:hypothetical protein
MIEQVIQVILSMESVKKDKTIKYLFSMRAAEQDIYIQREREREMKTAILSTEM